MNTHTYLSKVLDKSKQTKLSSLMFISFVLACINFMGCLDDTKIMKWYHGIKEFVCWQAFRNVKIPTFDFFLLPRPRHVSEGANINFAFMELKGWSDPRPTVALDA